jgi:hypothetical protein
MYRPRLRLWNARSGEKIREFSVDLPLLKEDPHGLYRPGQPAIVSVIEETDALWLLVRLPRLGRESASPRAEREELGVRGVDPSERFVAHLVAVSPTSGEILGSEDLGAFPVQFLGDNLVSIFWAATASSRVEILRFHVPSK